MGEFDGPASGQQGGGHAEGTDYYWEATEPAGDTWAHPHEVGLYCKAQEEGYCGTHALNALIGRRLATGPDMLAELRQKLGDGDGAHYGRGGWFSLEALNFFIYEHTPPGTCAALYPLALGLQGLNTPSGADWQRALETRGATRAIVNVGRRHWIIIARGCTPSSTGHWYILDSIPYRQCRRVRQMTSHDWDGATRNGWAINALAPIDAAAALAAGGRNGGEAHVPHPDWQAVPWERIAEASTLH
jgi:hypothetical protein